MDTGTGSRSDARMASALRRCAVLLRLVAHARTPARRRSAQTTTRRRMARTVHRHRSVRQLVGGPRRRLRRCLKRPGHSAVVIRTPALRKVICEHGRRRSPDTPRPFVSQQQRGRRRSVTAGPVQRQRGVLAGRRGSGLPASTSTTLRNRADGGPPTEPDGRARRHAHVWRTAGQPARREIVPHSRRRGHCGREPLSALADASPRGGERAQRMAR